MVLFVRDVDLIRLKGVTKEYKNHRVLDDINLTIEEGDLLGVIGQSGSGKTTLLNTIAGFIEPSEGEVTYYSKVDQTEKNLHKNFHKIKKHIGFTPQHNSFYHKLTVQENMDHFGRLYGLHNLTLKGNIDSLMKFMKLDDDKHKLAEHLSGGMQKRLDISCSLVHKPKILILDEPTADLDPILQRDVLQLLEQVNKQGITVILASHHLESIENVCNKIMILHKGKIHSHGLVDDVKKPFLRDHFTINIRSGVDKERLLKKLKGVPIEKIVDQGRSIVIYPSHVEKAVAAILAIIKEENLYLHDMDLRKPSLNEVFERVTSEQ